MKITALEIKQHEFEKSFRGYNIEEVDIFLNNLASEWERTSNESKMLRMQLEIAEKEAAKLREVEMSLIRTLQSAENTSNKITEHAKHEADKKIEDATLESQSILENAKKEAATILANANNQSESLLANAKLEVSANQKALIDQEANLKNEIAELESYKLDVISQLKTINAVTSEKLRGLEVPGSSLPKVAIKSEEIIIESVVEETVEQYTETQEEIVEEPVQGIASSANTMVLEKEQQKVEDDLTVIEGIGPKIADVLRSNGVSTFRDLATKPVYQVKEILGYAGSNYAMHDPSTWSEQALLADAGKWEELEALKDQLIGGKNISEEPEVSKESVVVENTPEQVTEEMLDRVNKVKAALKKAMIEKDGITVTEAAPKVRTINDIAADKAAEGSGSFFDNLG